MKLKKIYLFAILLMTLTVAKAQHENDDYIVTVKGDTILCAFRMNIWSHYMYKPTQAIKFTVIDTSVIGAYHFKENNVTYRAFRLPNTGKIAFLQQIDHGKITLYQLTLTGYKTSAYYWYAKKNNETLIEIKNTRRMFGDDSLLKQNFNSLITDDKTVLQLYNERNSYSIKTLKNIIHIYNNIRGKV